MPSMASSGLRTPTLASPREALGSRRRGLGHPARSARRALACGLTILVSAWAGPTDVALACEAMTGGDYYEPPEFVQFEVPPSSFEIAFRGVSDSYARKELVPPGETLTDWSQILSWHVTFGRKRFDLPKARDAFLSSMKAQCPSVGTRDIQTNPEDLIYEWWHDDCYDRPKQHQIMRLVAGATGTHTITYGHKGELPAEQRASWLERISGIEVRRQVRMDGDLSDFEEARLAVWNGEYDSAAKQLRPLAEQGSADAQELLGRLYFEGWGVPQDYAQSRSWLEKAHAQKHVRAAYSLGHLYDAGLGVPADPAKALELYKVAAKGGLADAEGRIGYLLVNGPPEIASPEEARGWFEKALTNGHTHARFWLGRLNEGGIGMEKNLDQAVQLYTQSATDGDPDAQYRLGMLYANGQGVETDLEIARVWLVRSAMQGNASAREFYAKTFGDSGKKGSGDAKEEAERSS